MNLVILAEFSLFSYQESPFIVVLKWVGTIVILAGLFGAVASAFQKTPTTPTDHSPSVKIPPGPVSQAGGDGQMSDFQTLGNTSGDYGAIKKSTLPVSFQTATSEVHSDSITRPKDVAAPDVVSRLKTLNRLREEGLVSDEIYEAKREQILQEL